jgi:hypothetical protein
MSIEAQTVEYVYVGDGTSTVFPFPSRFLSSADIIVGLAGVQQLTGFTVSGAGDDAGGNVTFLTAPTNGVRVSLIRKPPASQLVDFINGQTVLEGILDNALDKLTMIAQYLLRSNVRSIRLSDFDASTSLTPLPAVVDRANRFLAFDSNGDLALAANIGGVGVAPFASQAEAEAAVSTSAVMSPLRTKQQIDARLSSQALAEAGVDNVTLMTPLRTKQAILATATSSGSSMSFSTRAAAVAATIPAGVDRVVLSGRATAGDGGGGSYKRLGGAPGVTRSWHFQSAGGIWWQLEADPCYPKQFGALLDGTTDDTTAMQDWLDYVSSFRALGHGQNGSAKITTGTLSVGSNSVIDGKNCLTILRASDPVAYLVNLNAVTNTTIRNLIVSHTGGFASLTSNSIASGVKNFTVPAGLVGVVPGKYVQLTPSVSPSNYMIALVTAYSGTTLTVNVGTAVGAGTFADWRVDMYPDSGGNPGNVGIALAGCTDVTIENNKISGRFYHAMESRQGQSVAIRNNRVRGYVNRGISITSYAGTDSDTLVEGNEVLGDVYAQYGINCASVDGAGGARLRVVGNAVRETLFQGISVGGGHISPVVSDNTVWLTTGNGVGACILIQKVGAQSVSGAIVSGNGCVYGAGGVTVESCNYGTINNNTMNSCNVGIGLNGSQFYNAVVGNVINASPVYGIAIEGGGFNTVVGNVVNTAASAGIRTSNLSTTATVSCNVSSGGASPYALNGLNPATVGNL